MVSSVCYGSSDGVFLTLSPSAGAARGGCDSGGRHDS